MVRTVALLLIGLLAGLVAGHEFAARRAPALIERVAPSAPDADALAEVTGPSAAAATAVDPFARLARLAARAPSARRTVALGDALADAGRLAPARAARAAIALDLDARLLGSAFRRWVLVDPAAAVAAWAGVPPELDAREQVGIALVDGLGGDAAALDRVRGAVPAAWHGRDIEAALLVGLATTAPRVAFERLLAEPEPKRWSETLLGIALVWSRADPEAALAARATITDARLQARWTHRVLNAWSRDDPVAALDGLLSIDPDALRNGHSATNVMVALAARDPDRALSALVAHGGEDATHAWTTTVRRIAADDGEAARRAIAIAPEGLRDRLASEAARVLASTDPEAAMRWARSLASGRDAALAVIVPEIPSVDRAIAEAQGIADGRLVAQLAHAAARRGDIGHLVARLHAGALGEAGTRALPNALSWADADPEAAVSWYLANPVAGDPSWLVLAGHRLARSAPERATALTARLPEQARSRWINGVAEALAGRDPDAALAWLDGLPPGPTRDQGLQRAVARIAATDPMRASRTLMRIEADHWQRNAARAVAGEWVRREGPEAALAWTRDLDAAPARAAATGAVVDAWAGRGDLTAARDWVLAQPPAPALDDAIDTLLRYTFAEMRVDHALIAHFSSDAVRQQALAGTLPRLAERAPEAAGAVFQRYVTDPELRARTVPPPR